MAQLTGLVKMVIVLLRNSGLDKDRVFNSLKSRNTKKALRKQIAIEEYFKIKNRDGLAFHRIATIIKDRLGANSVSVDTIKRYLKEEGCF